MRDYNRLHLFFHSSLFYTLTKHTYIQKHIYIVCALCYNLRHRQGTLTTLSTSPQAET